MVVTAALCKISCRVHRQERLAPRTSGCRNKTEVIKLPHTHTHTHTHTHACNLHEARSITGPVSQPSFRNRSCVLSPRSSEKTVAPSFQSLQASRAGMALPAQGLYGDTRRWSAGAHATMALEFLVLQVLARVEACCSRGVRQGHLAQNCWVNHAVVACSVGSAR